MERSSGVKSGWPGPGRVGSGGVKSGRAGPGRVGLGRIRSGRVGSGRERVVLRTDDGVFNCVNGLRGNKPRFFFHFFFLLIFKIVDKYVRISYQ